MIKLRKAVSSEASNYTKYHYRPRIISVEEAGMPHYLEDLWQQGMRFFKEAGWTEWWSFVKSGEGWNCARRLCLSSRPHLHSKVAKKTEKSRSPSSRFGLNYAWNALSFSLYHLVGDTKLWFRNAKQKYHSRQELVKISENLYIAALADPTVLKHDVLLMLN